MCSRHLLHSHLALSCSDPEPVALLCRAGANLGHSVPSVQHRKTSPLTAAMLVEAPEARSQIVHTLLQVCRGTLACCGVASCVYRDCWVVSPQNGCLKLPTLVYYPACHSHTCSTARPLTHTTS